MKKSSKAEMLFAVLTLSVIGLAPSMMAEADTNNRAANTAESAKEHTQEAGRDIGKHSKKIGRKIEDAACPLVNGKLECKKERIENDLKNTGDEVKDKLNEPSRRRKN